MERWGWRGLTSALITRRECAQEAGECAAGDEVTSVEPELDSIKMGRLALFCQDCSDPVAGLRDRARRFVVNTWIRTRLGVEVLIRQRESPLINHDAPRFNCPSLIARMRRRNGVAVHCLELVDADDRRGAMGSSGAAKNEEGDREVSEQPHMRSYCGLLNNPTYTALPRTWPCIAAKTVRRMSSAMSSGVAVLVKARGANSILVSRA